MSFTGEESVLELDSTFAEVQARNTNTQNPIVPTGQTGVVPITSISGGSTGFGVSIVGALATLLGVLTTKGDLYARTNAVGTRLPVAADDARLTSDSSQATGLKWVAASTGWGAASGTLSRATYASYAGQVVSNPPTQAEMQILDDAVKLLSRTVAAMLTDQFTRKEIKA